MRTIRKLLSMDGRVYVFLRSRNICRLFQEQAESEGFLFETGSHRLSARLQTSSR